MEFGEEIGERNGREHNREIDTKKKKNTRSSRFIHLTGLSRILTRSFQSNERARENLCMYYYR